MARKTVRCRKCDRRFTQQEWLENTTCDNPGECGCPKVRASMAQAQQVISVAKEKAGYKVIRLEETIPTNRDETVDQLWVNASPVLSIQVIKPPRKRN